MFRWIKNLFKPSKGPDYLIEFRFHGYAKKYLKNQIWTVSKKFRVKGVTQKKIVPHISLIGQFKTNDEETVVSKFVSICKKYHLIHFNLTGFGHFEDRVIFADIKPSKELVQFRQELFKELEPKIYTVDTDYLDPFAFHATIAFKDIGKKFNKIWRYLENVKTAPIKQTLLRATIVKNRWGNRRILYEYDFMQKKLLDRKQALNRNTFKRTIELLKKADNTVAK